MRKQIWIPIFRVLTDKDVGKKVRRPGTGHEGTITGAFKENGSWFIVLNGRNRRGDAELGWWQELDPTLRGLAKLAAVERNL